MSAASILLAADQLDGLGALALDAVLKGGLLLLVALLMSAALRRASAALRHMVWALALGGSLVLPVLSAAVPAWRVPLLPDLSATAPADAINQRRDVPAEESLSGAPSPEVSSTSATGESTEGSAPPPTAIAMPVGGDSREPARGEMTLSLSNILALVWLAGMVLVLLPVAAGIARVHWVARRARSATGSGRWARLAPSVVAEAGIRRRVRIIEAAGATMPMTWGILRPVVLLPEEVGDWTDRQRRDVLRHELAHVRRFDCLTQLLAHLACAVYWFDPLVWVAARRLRVERERACDDDVLRSGAKASEYAEHLLGVARSMRPAPATAFAALAMARRSQLSGRLLAVLDDRRSRARVSRGVAMPTSALAAGLVFGLAALTPTPRAAEAATGTETAAAVDAGELRLDVAVAPPATLTAEVSEAPAPETVPPDVEQLVQAGLSMLGQDACDRLSNGKSGTHTNMISTDKSRGSKRWTVRWSSGDCSFELDARGEITYNRDATDVQSISAGGYFEIEEKNGDRSRRLVIKPRPDGSLERTYYLDGDRRDIDSAAQEWLATSFVRLDRRTAFAVDQRLPALLAKGGVPAVLAEIELMGADYARRVYFTKLLEQRRLDAAQVREVVEQAGRSIESDYELTELLIAFAKLDSFGAQAHIPYVQAVRTLDSDYERRRALSAILSREMLGDEAVKAVLEAASDMDSDYELAELLIATSKRYAMDDRTRPVYIAALGSLESDYEHRRVLSAIMNGGGLTPAVTRSLLQDATRIDSDYELAEFLIAIAKKGALDASNRADYFAAVKKLDSDYEHRRTLTPVLRADLLTKELVKDILESARSIDSDYECASLLAQVAAVFPIDAELRPSYERAAETIGDEYEYGRAMSALRKGRS